MFAADGENEDEVEAFTRRSTEGTELSTVSRQAEGAKASLEDVKKKAKQGLIESLQSGKLVEASRGFHSISWAV